MRATTSALLLFLLGLVGASDTLVLAGEAVGKFEEDTKRERLMLARLDMVSKWVDWTVAPIGAKTTQSGAQALTIDDQGRFVVVGYVCGDDCEPEGEMRIYDPKGGLVWLASLGAFPTKELTGRDIAWNPAGFAVVATGGTKGKEAAFVVRAFAPFKYDALWTYTHQDNQALQFVNTLAIGRSGESYAGGFGANGYPAVAYIVN